MRHRERERGRDTGGGRSRLHAGSQTWDSIRTPGLCPGPKAGAKPLSHPGIPTFSVILVSHIQNSDSTIIYILPGAQYYKRTPYSLFPI